MRSLTPAERAARVVAGDVRVAARLLRDLDDERPGAQSALAALAPHIGRARVIGITGNPGAGKSTLTDRLITHYREAGLKVAVIAIDPSSPFSGGAILGDRIRMQGHAGDSGVFIRSLATRGVLGGLSGSTRDAIEVFDAMGFEVILVETVGVGQDEVDVVNTVQTSVVVTVPGLGDGVQAIKAGLLEIADIYVVNKADHPHFEQARRQLQLMLQIEPPRHAGWERPVLSAVATRGEGIEALVEAVEAHRVHLQETSEGARRLKARLRAAARDRIYGRLRRLADRAVTPAQFDAQLDRMAAGTVTAYDVANEVLSAMGLNSTSS